MSDTPEYILKKPVDASYYEEGLMAVEFEELSECLIISDEQFQNTFQPLDIPAMEKQLEQLLAPFIFMSSQEGYYELEDNELFEKLNSEDDTKVIVAEVLAVFGLENKETNK